MFGLYPSGPVDVQWTSIERSYRTCGRLVDVPNETQLVRQNRTKMDVHFERPLGSYQTSTRRLLDAH